MNREIYRIQILSLREAVEHLRLIDLAELAICAREHGTPSDQGLIAAVSEALPGIPPTHP